MQVLKFETRIVGIFNFKIIDSNIRDIHCIIYFIQYDAINLVNNEGMAAKFLQLVQVAVFSLQVT